MDMLTCYFFILFAALGLCFISVVCLAIDTALAIKRYINEKQYMKQIKETETNTSGGN